MIRFVFKSLWLSVKENMILHSAAVLTTFLCMVLVIFSMSFSSSLRGWLQQMDRSVRLLVQVDHGQGDAVQVLLSNLPGVARSELMSNQEVADSIGRVLGIDSPEDLAELGLPRMIRVTPDGEVFVGPAVLADRIAELAGVRSVEYGQRWLQRFHEAADTALRLSGVLLLFLAAAAFLILTTTDTLILYSRRRELEIMDMVGASLGHIYVPVVLEGMFQSLIGTGLALVVVQLIWSLAGEALTVFGSELSGGIGRNEALLFIVAGMVLGMLASSAAMMQSISKLVEED